VGVLTGSRAADIVRRGHDRLSTFGLLRTHDKGDVSSYVAQLVDAGALRRTGDEYPVLELTELGADVLRGSAASMPLRRSVHVQREQARQRAEAAAHTSPLSTAEGRLFDALRSLRRRLAEKLGVPPYIVFSDDTLRELARLRPGSTAAMLEVRGVGKVKLGQFGAEFLAAIAEQAGQLGLTLDPGPGAGSAAAPR
jgi:ATP-dependent DNA helicase RecQ